MNNRLAFRVLHDRLCTTESIGRRQRIIREFLNSDDITGLLPRGVHILPEIAIRSHGEKEGIFVVGEEYCSRTRISHGHDGHKHYPLYVLGIVNLRYSILIIEPKSKKPQVVDIFYLDQDSALPTIPYVEQPAV
jgi:hypothetical protein